MKTKKGFVGTCGCDIIVTDKEPREHEKIKVIGYSLISKKNMINKEAKITGVFSNET